MQEGSDFLKVRSYSRQFRRIYKLNENFTAIHWHPTSKKPSKALSKNFLFLLISTIKFSIVTIDSIKEIRPGKTSERLREHAHQYQNESLFSIIYTNGISDYVSLDLVANNADEANIWITGLSCLIAGHHLDEREKMRDRWLRETFLAGLSSPRISSNEYQFIIEKNFIDEDEARRLLIDYGISENKAKTRLKVNKF